MQIFLLLSHFLVVLLEGFGLSFCMNHFCPSLNSPIQDSGLWSRIRPWKFRLLWIMLSPLGPKAEMEAQTFRFPPPHFTVWRRTSTRPLVCPSALWQSLNGQFSAFLGAEASLYQLSNECHVHSFFTWLQTHVHLSRMLPEMSATLWRWSEGQPLLDLLFFWCFLVKVLIVVHFWAELWWCWVPSICEWFVL